MPIFFCSDSASANNCLWERKREREGVSERERGREKEGEEEGELK